MKRFLVLGLFSLLIGCATVDSAKPPSIQLSNIRLGNGGLLNQELLIEIRIGNTNILSVFRQLMFLGKSDTITYRLHGTAYVGRLGINSSVPYERKGRLSLQDALPGQPGKSVPPGGGGVRTLAPVAL